MLRRTDLSLMETCLAAGFESPVFFQDLFLDYGAPREFGKIKDAERCSDLRRSVA